MGICLFVCLFKWGLTLYPRLPWNSLIAKTGIKLLLLQTPEGLYCKPYTWSELSFQKSVNHKRVSKLDSSWRQHSRAACGLVVIMQEMEGKNTRKVLPSKKL